jgi:hypothetical protein
LDFNLTEMDGIKTICYGLVYPLISYEITVQGDTVLQTYEATVYATKKKQLVSDVLHG